MRVAVVGGGISGLVSAYVLNKEGVKVVLYEKQDHLGGHAKTVNVEGLDLDLAFMLFNRKAPNNTTRPGILPSLWTMTNNNTRPGILPKPKRSSHPSSRRSSTTPLELLGRPPPLPSQSMSSTSFAEYADAEMRHRCCYFWVVLRLVKGACPSREAAAARCPRFPPSIAADGSGDG
ncbi:hypothetical protein PIB30_011210 [Stylosanthes scabra]|uniref:Uncharacterized protein n=1 Tax=Stylosanthes scabra TaxID=79078 RepID=A0ABU6S668_9FABA|nr:hypothetical protein [Stylosanthes scabra]